MKKLQVLIITTLMYMPVGLCAKAIQNLTYKKVKFHKTAAFDFASDHFIKGMIKKSHWHGLDLAGFNFTEVKGTKAKFNDANLYGARFNAAQLKKAKFKNACCKNARFDGADLKNASFKNADLSGASFNGAVFHDINFDGADLSGIQLKGVIIRGRKNSLVGAVNVPESLVVAFENARKAYRKFPYFKS